MSAAAPEDARGDGERISRDTLESALRDLQADIDRETPPLLVRVAYGASAAATALVVLAYVFGRRAGRRRRTVVEVRRF
ncbi:MAG: hypothetical protein OXE79_02950 [Acidimicrobiaceae bacterium]|nr:hypothetical protein [Acidimicrobiaceae bacterium]MCY4279803.1 hypothetical protein [Acidimicrobiaceae bacterium]MCY4295082.1 hypothetical protein [Acidimicrobiaceae bacterium]